MVLPGHKTTQLPNLIENRMEKRVRIVKKSKKPIRFVASSGGKKGDSIRIYHKGSMVARWQYKDCMDFTLRASGLWLCYATLQNLIPSFPWPS